MMYMVRLDKETSTLLQIVCHGLLLVQEAVQRRCRAKRRWPCTLHSHRNLTNRCSRAHFPKSPGRICLRYPSGNNQAMQFHVCELVAQHMPHIPPDDVPHMRVGEEGSRTTHTSFRVPCILIRDARRAPHQIEPEADESCFWFGAGSPPRNRSSSLPEVFMPVLQARAIRSTSAVSMFHPPRSAKPRQGAQDVAETWLRLVADVASSRVLIMRTGGELVMVT